MRIKRNTPDFEAISRRSIQKDFQRQRIHPEKNKAPQIKDSRKLRDKRVAQVHENCQYAKYSRLIVGKAVRCVDMKDERSGSGWYEFVFDEDRKALNQAAGWSDNKKLYLLERPKLR